MGRPRILIPPCGFCGRKFRRQEHLLRHERTHTHEKPYLCGCGKEYSRPDILASHMRRAHPEDSIESGVATNEKTSVLEAGRDSEAGNLPGTSDFEDPRDPDSVAAETALSLSSPAVGRRTMQYFQDPVASPTQERFFGPVADSGNPTAPGQANDDLDLLWINEWPFPEILPESFFDTNVSLTDLSRQYCQNLRPEQPTSGLPVAQERQSLYQDSSHSPPTTRSTLEYAMNHEILDGVTENEVEPSQDCRLEGNINPSVLPWKISPSEFEAVSQELNSLLSIIGFTFSIPSRHTLSRFLEGYFRGFHEHMPFIHTPSCSVLTLGPELTLSLAAVGALYRFEHAKGYKLYQAARALLNWRLAQRNEPALSMLPGHLSRHAGFSEVQSQTPSIAMPTTTGTSPSDHNSGESKSTLRLLQSLTALMAMATWGNQAVVQDSLTMSGHVAPLVRKLGISAPDASHASSSWETWVEQEERRRTLYVAYILFNLQCVAFNIPPMILNREVSLTLPACRAEWTAPNSQEWKRMRALHFPVSRPFQRVLGELVQGNQIHRPDAISSFANYVLIHGLLQEIFFASNTASLMEPAGFLKMSFVQTMESALRAWQQSWEATYESTLDPLSPRGPMGFNATALLRLAYIRLNANTGPNRQLSTRNPLDVAHGFIDGKTAVYDRSPHLDRAILQCIHALSVPVRLGIPFIARTQTLSWSIQHSLCHLECAFLLNHWLEVIAQAIDASGAQAIREDEHKLLKMIHGIIREADLMEIADWAFGDASAVRRLAAYTIRLWAEMFTGAHVFEISRVVGESLAIIADILEAQLVS